MKLTLLVFSVFIFVGCATKTSVTYSVYSDPSPAPLDVNGVSMGETPTTVSLECAKKWVGLAMAPGGWANASGSYEVKVFPPKGSTGLSQSKLVDPCQWAGQGNPELRFDLNLQAVAPTQKLEITSPSNSGSLEQAIEALKTLKNSGLLTEEEYKQKLYELTQ